MNLRIDHEKPCHTGREGDIIGLMPGGRRASFFLWARHIEEMPSKMRLHGPEYVVAQVVLDDWYNTVKVYIWNPYGIL